MKLKIDLGNSPSSFDTNPLLRKAVNDHIASDILGELIDTGVVIFRTQQRWKKAA